MPTISSCASSSLKAIPICRHSIRSELVRNIKEILDADLKAEYEARALYKEARDVCKDEGDYVSMELFEKLMSDEEGHIDFLETQIDLHDTIGDKHYGLLNASSADEGLNESEAPPKAV